MTRACNSGRGQKKKKKKKEDGSSRSYRRPTFLPFGRVPGALSRLLFSPFPCYYRPYLGLAVSFLPRHHVPRTRVLYLADSTDLSSPNTAASFSFNLAAEKSVDSSLLFLFSFFFLSLSWYFHQLPFHLFPSVSKAISFSLSLSFIFFLPVYLSIYLSIWIRWNQAFRLFVSAVSSHGWFWWTNHPTSFEHGQRLHEYASRWPRPTGVDAGGGKWHVGQKSLHLVVFDTPVHQPGPGGTRDGTRVLEIEFDLRFGNFFGSGFCYKFPHWKVRLGRRFWIRFWRISDKRSVLRNYVIALHDLARDFLGKWLKRGKKKGRNNWKQEKEINFT